MLNEIIEATLVKANLHVCKFGPLENKDVKIFVSRKILLDIKKEFENNLFTSRYSKKEDETDTLLGYEVIEMKKDGYLIMIDSGAV